MKGAPEPEELPRFTGREVVLALCVVGALNDAQVDGLDAGEAQQELVDLAMRTRIVFGVESRKPGALRTRGRGIVVVDETKPHGP